MAFTGCPNKNSEEWKKLEGQFGTNLASSIFHRNNGVIPTVEQGAYMIKASKIGQFKSAVKYLSHTTSGEITDLLPNLFKIVQKVGNDFFVVKGSPIDEAAKPGAEFEIHKANRTFLDTVNKEFGAPLFTVEKVDLNPEVSALRKDVIGMLQSGEFKSLYGLTYKNYAENPELHDTILNELSEQAKDPTNRREMAESFGESFVDKLYKYSSLTNKEEGVPAGKRLFNEPNPETEKISENYKQKNEIVTPKGKKITSLNTDYSKRIANAFEEMAHNPNDPEVKAAYNAMAKETLQQYKAVEDAGYKVEIYEGKGEPYKNSQEMTKDVRDNKHLFVLSTEKEFGSNPITDQQREENPLLKESGIKDVNGKPLLVNDVFRFVHDFFGHTERGNSFGPVGEENAFDVHARMFGKEARRAMTTETRGQNSWVNFGNHLRNEKGEIIKKGEPGYISPVDRPFAQQKMGLLAEEFSTFPEQRVSEEEPKVKPTEDTYRVSINQEALKQIAAKNIEEKEKNPLVSSKETLDSNQKILEDKAPEYSKAYGESQVASVNKNVLNYLRDKFNLPFEIVNDTTADWRGKFENGKIFINAAKINQYTALHEYLHPFMGAMEKDNPELYNNLINELRTNKEGQQVLQDVKENYPELSSKEQLDEALVTHLSQIARTGDIKERPWYQKIIDWFKEMFSKNGISISGLDMNMSLSDIADKIVDPTYSADLKKYYSLNDTATMFQKVYSDNFEQLLDKIKTKLKLDVNITPKNEDEKTRKYFSGRQLAALEAGKDIYGAINDYVTSAIVNNKKIVEKFDAFKSFYEGNNGKISKEDALNGMKILSEMENHIVLYKESRYVLDAIREENADEYDDNFSLLANRLNKDTTIINSYNEYGLKLMADWLYPSTKKVVEGYIKNGNKEKMPGYEQYLDVKKNNPNLNEQQAIETGVKKWLSGQMQHATSDVGFFTSYLTGVLNSKDPVSQLVALSLKDEFSKNNTQLFRVKKGINEQVKKIMGNKILTTNAQNKEFYSKYLRQVDNWEKTGVDDQGNPTYGYVKRTAFHEPYQYDKFYNEKRDFFKKIGVRPNKNDEVAYKDWEAKKENWFNQNTVRVTNDKGETIKVVPSVKFKNAQFDSVANDPLFKEIYKHYTDANGKLGQYQLKYGIVPQKSLGGGLFSDLKLKKGFKGNAEQLKKNLKEGIGSELSSYYAQDIDGREYKNVPIRGTHMVEEEDLDYNLGQSVADFWEHSSKYETAKKIEPMVMTLRSFIEGNASLNVAQRDAPEVDAKGVKKMGNYIKNITKTKDQANINRQLVDFLNDTVYGESEKKANIKSPFANLKYLVYKEGDTSANGKPHKEYVYSLEDLKQKTGNEKIDYDHFEKGTERKVGDYNVTLMRNDKIVSVNKLGRGLNTLSATINLGANVIAGTSHLLRGVASNFIEATGGKYFNNKEWGSAYKDYFKNLVGFNFIEDARGGKGSLVSQHLSHYGTFQGEFLNEFGHKIGAGVVNKLFRRSSMFFSLHGAEHMIQTTQMLAAMKHIKVEDGRGNLISLDKAFEIGKDGYRKVKDGVKWTEQQDNDFRDMIQSINKDRGNYSEFDKAGISRLWWGKMLIMFRRHIMNGIKSRWGSDYVDFERGGATQGYYRSFMTTLVSEYNEFRLNGKFRKLTQDEQYHAKKTLADLGMFAMLATVLVPAFRNKEQHDNDLNDYLALFARRLQMDVSFYVNPLEWKKVIQSPVVTGSSVDKIYDFLQQATISPSEEYQKDGAGYSAGDNKALHKLGKVIPGYREFLNLQEPQDLLKFYDLNKSGGQGQ
jgi:hypothetical protein